MKTKAYTYLKLCLVGIALMGLASCEVNFHDNDDIGGAYYEKSRALCSRIWADTFIDIDGNRCYQELTFFLDRHGEDYIRVEYPNGRVQENVYLFDWHWTDRSQYSLEMYYGPGDVSYLDNVWISGNVMSGYLDGHDNYVDYVGI